jgi:hypothetical protein
VSQAQRRQGYKDEDTIKTTCNLWLHKDKIKKFKASEAEGAEKPCKSQKSYLLKGIKKTFRWLLSRSLHPIKSGERDSRSSAAANSCSCGFSAKIPEIADPDKREKR